MLTFFIGFCIFGIMHSFFSSVYALETASVIPSSYRNYGTPSDMVVLDNGNLWYADSRNYRLVQVQPDGTIVRTVGRQGSGDGEFDSEPNSITQDSDGNLYVTASCRVYSFEPNGAFRFRFGECDSAPQEIGETHGIHYSANTDKLYISDVVNDRVMIFTTDGTYVDEFGTAGSGNGQFNNPWGIWTDEDENIYVVDVDNHRVQLFNSAYNFVRSYGNNDPGPGQLSFPKDLLVLPDGDILVPSQNAQKVVRFDASGSYESEWGVNGYQNSQFNCPQFVAPAASNTFWLNDCSLNRLQRFDYSGNLQNIIQNSGITDGLFTQPLGLDFDSNGDMYVLDGNGDDKKVQKLESNGTYISTPVPLGETGFSAYHIKVGPAPDHNVYVSNEFEVRVFDQDGNQIDTIGIGGSGPGEFNQARGMDFDSNGNLYVADMANSRVQVFDTNHNFLFAFGSLGTADGQFDSPSHIFITDDDEVYVGSNWDDYRGGGNPRVVRIQVFDTSGNFVRALDATNQQFNGDGGTTQFQINGLYVSDTGDVYVSDGYLHRVMVFNSSGEYVSTIGRRGGEVTEFLENNDIVRNPANGDLYISDTKNNRIHRMQEGRRIYALISSADVVKTDDSTSIARQALNPSAPDINNIESYLTFGDDIVSSFTVDLSVNRNWSAVNTVFSEDSKSLVVNLNPTDAPGVSNTHSIYVARYPGQTSVRVCPDATTIADVTLTCTNGYTLVESDADLTAVTINSTNYWKIDNLTGTGAMSEMPEPTPTPTPGPGTPTPTNPPSVTTTPGPTSTPGGPTPTPDGICRDNKPGEKVPSLFGAIPKDDATVTLYFTPADAPVSRYELEYGTSSGTYTQTVSDLGVNSKEVMTYEAKGLSNGTEYFFRVRARNGCAYGNWSNEISSKTGALIIRNALSMENTDFVTNEKKDTSSPEDTKKEEDSEEPEEIATDEKEVQLLIKDTQGNPLAGAKVTVGKTTVITDEKGIARIKGLAAGENKLSIEHEGYSGEQTVYYQEDTPDTIEVTVTQKDLHISSRIFIVAGMVIAGLIAVTAIIYVLLKKK